MGWKESLVKELTKTLHRWKLRYQPSLSSSAGPRGRPYNLSYNTRRCSLGSLWVMSFWMYLECAQVLIRFGWENLWAHECAFSIDLCWESHKDHHIATVIKIATIAYNSHIPHPIICATIFVSLWSSDTLGLFGIRCIYLSCDVPWCSKHVSKTFLSLEAGSFISSFQRLHFHN